MTTPQKTSDLAAKSQAFAAEVGESLSSTLGTDKQMASVQLDDRYAVRPAGDEPHQRKVPLYVGQQHVADLVLAIYLTLDRSGEHLKAAGAVFRVFATLDRTPLLRMEYRSDMHVDPVCHWQVHAERGAFTHLLSMANAIDSRRVRRPHDLSTVHLSVGGERFRPCLEDSIELLIRDCGVDHLPEWGTCLHRRGQDERCAVLGARYRHHAGGSVRAVRGNRVRADELRRFGTRGRLVRFLLDVSTEPIAGQFIDLWVEQ